MPRTPLDPAQMWSFETTLREIQRTGHEERVHRCAALTEVGDLEAEPPTTDEPRLGTDDLRGVCGRSTPNRANPIRCVEDVEGPCDIQQLDPVKGDENHGSWNGRHVA